MFIIMNKIHLINTQPRVMAALANLALFGEVQKRFNLHPGKLATQLIVLALERGQLATVVVDSLAEELIPKVREAFATTLIEVEALLSVSGKAPTESGIKTGLTIPCLVYFKLEPTKIAKDIRNRIEQAGMDPLELVENRWTQGQITAMQLRFATRDIIPWAFAEAVRMVKEPAQ